MKRNIQKGVVGAAGSFLLFAGIAFAAENAMTGDAMMQKDTMMKKDSMMPSSMMMMHAPAPMILSVTNDGMGRVRGVVASVNATSLTIAAWGGMWTITTDSYTKMLPAGSGMADIKVGDYVGVVGMVSENSPTITATTVRNWTTKHDAMMMKKSDAMMSSEGSMMHKDDSMMSDKNAMMVQELMKKVEAINNQIMMEKQKMQGDHMMMSSSSGSMMSH